ncbi:ribokinase [Lactiplantibacillus sp. WILCCON 0030]|uniref:Ribokinase n=1 Tax=Lactiplantibacillus brownii TaxID=3069269 RepID=A0ABU1AAL6_9LACO|nr:ribokinase [Lactiplantibacillus brownii]MDQ7937680.1 ribokinase [Lactiplantibacillus brownii]
MNKVTILGSLNVDTILRVKRFPKPGETLPLSGKSVAGGGKGANQAIAAARAGAHTTFIGKVGQDQEGDFMVKQLTDSGVAAQFVQHSSEANTGSAVIMLDSSSENRILIDGGTNQLVTAADVDLAQTVIAASDFLIAQFETPIAATMRGFELAHAANQRTILNPAPATHDVPAKLLSLTDLIVPNETETETLTGVPVTDEHSMIKAAAVFQQLGVANVIITVGSKGAFWQRGQAHGFVPAYKVNAVDTTAAGDTFIGALSSVLRPDFSNLAAAVRFANRASSLAVQKLGAQPSIPTRAAILAAERA